MRSNEHPDVDQDGTVQADRIDADAEIVAGEEPPSAKRRLSRELVVTTGLAYVDEHGLEGLSMRRLGAVLGVEAMSLYRYVPSKEDLLDAIVDAMVDEMRTDGDTFRGPSHGWQEFLQRLAHGVRRVALAHTMAFPLIVSRPPEAPWIRPPLRSVEWVEHFLHGLTIEGFSDQGAVEAYRAFTSFLLGHLLLEVSSRGAEVGPMDHAEFEVEVDQEDDGLAGLPTVERLRTKLAAHHFSEEFEVSLENLLERLERILREHPRREPR